MSLGYTVVKPTFDGSPLEVSLPPEETWGVQLKENDGYEGKVPLDPSLRAWEVEHKNYSPLVIATSNLAQGVEKGLAHPADVSSLKPEEMKSYYDWLSIDSNGLLRNPLGRTNTRGGFLYQVGGNFCADPILLYREGEHLVVLAVTKDLVQFKGKVLLPGGMCEAGEAVSAVLARELREETGVIQSFEQATPVYAGIVPSSRNVDERWSETISAMLVLESEVGRRLKPKVYDTQEIEAVYKYELTPESINKLVPGHRHYLNLALAVYATRNPDMAEYSYSLINAV